MGKRKTIKHFHEPGHLHEFTFSCFHRHPLLARNDFCVALAHSINRANAEMNVELVAFVFMPDHVHLLVRPLETHPDLGRYLAKIKQPTTKIARNILESENPTLLDALLIEDREGKTSCKFWQSGPGYDRNLWTTESLLASMEYIHANPVKRNLCQAAADWKWSSARWYEALPRDEHQGDLPRVHGLDANNS